MSLVTWIAFIFCFMSISALCEAHLPENPTETTVNASFSDATQPSATPRAPFSLTYSDCVEWSKTLSQNLSPNQSLMSAEERETHLEKTHFILRIWDSERSALLSNIPTDVIRFIRSHFNHFDPDHFFTIWIDVMQKKSFGELILEQRRYLQHITRKLNKYEIEQEAKIRVIDRIWSLRGKALLDRSRLNAIDANNKVTEAQRIGIALQLQQLGHQIPLATVTPTLSRIDLSIVTRWLSQMQEYTLADLELELRRSLQLFVGQVGAEQKFLEALELLPEEGKKESQSHQNIRIRHWEQGLPEYPPLLEGTRLLYSLAQRGYASLLESLLLQGEDPNMKIKGSTPLLIAIFNNKQEALDVLLRHHADPNGASSKGLTPLILAAKNGHIEIVRSLISHGAAVNKTDGSGFSPLHSAVYQGHAETVRFLLSVGADPSLRSNRGISSFDIARKKGNFEIIAILEGDTQSKERP